MLEARRKASVKRKAAINVVLANALSSSSPAAHAAVGTLSVSWHAAPSARPVLGLGAALQLADHVQFGSEERSDDDPDDHDRWLSRAASSSRSSSEPNGTSPRSRVSNTGAADC